VCLKATDLTQKLQHLVDGINKGTITKKYCEEIVDAKKASNDFVGALRELQFQLKMP